MKRPWDGSLDVLRTGAAVLVVLLHCSGSLRPLAEFGPEWWGTALLQAFSGSSRQETANQITPEILAG